ncbi:hypothetical protein [Streptomyces sp. MUM 178J]|uniref:hypothetical protein n=1 Tax=Streptomyces sp. MUM 178J TaxID=2791991 RepID=UPI001F03E918|nr:hypothetical protein [Streptomyces sp. MUM 178J]WRQ80345.1 hypothetical protein I3F59_013875 [Streptomyces sp. MUM 178J]
MTISFEMKEVATGHGSLLWSGTTAEFGDIEVIYPADLGPGNGTGAEVRGSSIPGALFTGDSLLGFKPRLTGMKLLVEGEEVKPRRNRWAVSKKRRSLRLAYKGTTYRCTAISRKSYVFTRPGLAITVSESGVRRKNRRARVQADGPATPIDISLAVLFAGVDRPQLTMGGAFRVFLSTVFHLSTNG